LLLGRRALLESYLRTQYTTLATGQVVTVRQLERTISLRVVELQPAPAVCIIGARRWLRA